MNLSMRTKGGTFASSFVAVFVVALSLSCHVWYCQAFSQQPPPIFRGSSSSSIPISGGSFLARQQRQKTHSHGPFTGASSTGSKGGAHRYCSSSTTQCHLHKRRGGDHTDDHNNHRELAELGQMLDTLKRHVMRQQQKQPSQQPRVPDTTATSSSTSSSSTSLEEYYHHAKSTLPRLTRIQQELDQLEQELTALEQSAQPKTDRTTFTSTNRRTSSSSPPQSSPPTTSTKFSKSFPNDDNPKRKDALIQEALQRISKDKTANNDIKAKDAALESSPPPTLQQQQQEGRSGPSQSTGEHGSNNKNSDNDNHQQQQQITNQHPLLRKYRQQHEQERAFMAAMQKRHAQQLYQNSRMSTMPVAPNEKPVYMHAKDVTDNSNRRRRRRATSSSESSLNQAASLIDSIWSSSQEDPETDGTTTTDAPPTKQRSSLDKAAAMVNRIWAQQEQEQPKPQMDNNNNITNHNNDRTSLASVHVDWSDTRRVTASPAVTTPMESSSSPTPTPTMESTSTPNHPPTLDHPSNNSVAATEPAMIDPTSVALLAHFTKQWTLEKQRASTNASSGDSASPPSSLSSSSSSSRTTGTATPTEESSSSSSSLPDRYQVVTQWAQRLSTPPTPTHVLFQLRNYKVAEWALQGHARWGVLETLRAQQATTAMLQQQQENQQQQQQLSIAVRQESTPPPPTTTSSMGPTVSESPSSPPQPLAHSVAPESMHDLAREWTQRNRDVNETITVSAVKPSVASMEDLAREWTLRNKDEEITGPDQTTLPETLLPSSTMPPPPELQSIEDLAREWDTMNKDYTDAGTPQPRETVVDSVPNSRTKSPSIQELAQQWAERNQERTSASPEPRQVTNDIPFPPISPNNPETQPTIRLEQEDRAPVAVAELFQPSWTPAFSSSRTTTNSDPIADGSNSFLSDLEPPSETATRDHLQADWMARNKDKELPSSSTVETVASTKVHSLQDMANPAQASQQLAQEWAVRNRDPEASSSLSTCPTLSSQLPVYPSVSSKPATTSPTMDQLASEWSTLNKLDQDS